MRMGKPRRTGSGVEGSLVSPVAVHALQDVDLAC